MVKTQSRVQMQLHELERAAKDKAANQAKKAPQEVFKWDEDVQIPILKPAVHLPIQTQVQVQASV